MTRPPYADRPVVVAWEMTRACRLACAHCRASAQSHADPAELTTRESRDLIDQLAEAGRMLLILTGGDPARRKDLVELAAHARPYTEKLPDGTTREFQALTVFLVNKRKRPRRKYEDVAFASGTTHASRLGASLYTLTIPAGTGRDFLLLQRCICNRLL